MRKRTRVVAVVVVAAMLASTVLAAIGMVLRRPVVSIPGDVPGDGPLAVFVAGDGSGASRCADDAAVARSWMSLSLPSTASTFVLVDDAGRADLERVAACVLAGVGDRGTVTVGRVSEDVGVGV